jgi:mono/diheme cytochrome c family protein
MRIEIKGLIAALAAIAVVLGGAFGLSAIMASHSHQAPFQSMSASMKADKQKMTASMTAADVQAQLVQGHQFFTVSCASCHGAKGQGAIGPSLYNSDLTDAKIATIITNGVKGRMPAFGSTYKDPQVQALTAYIRSLKK